MLDINHPKFDEVWAEIDSYGIKKHHYYISSYGTVCDINGSLLPRCILGNNIIFVGPFIDDEYNVSGRILNMLLVDTFGLEKDTEDTGEYLDYIYHNMAMCMSSQYYSKKDYKINIGNDHSITSVFDPNNAFTFKADIASSMDSKSI